MKADDDIQLQTNNNEERPSPAAVAPQISTETKPWKMMVHTNRFMHRRSNDELEENIPNANKTDMLSIKRINSTEIMKVEQTNYHLERPSGLRDSRHFSESSVKLMAQQDWKLHHNKLNRISSNIEDAGGSGTAIKKKESLSVNMFNSELYIHNNSYRAGGVDNNDGSKHAKTTTARANRLIPPSTSANNYSLRQNILI